MQRQAHIMPSKAGRRPWRRSWFVTAVKRPVVFYIALHKSTLDCVKIPPCLTGCRAAIPLMVYPARQRRLPAILHVQVNDVPTAPGAGDCRVRHWHDRVRDHGAAARGGEGPGRYRACRRHAGFGLRAGCGRWRADSGNADLALAAPPCAAQPDRPVYCRQRVMRDGARLLVADGRARGHCVLPRRLLRHWCRCCRRPGAARQARTGCSADVYRPDPGQRTGCAVWYRTGSVGRLARHVLGGDRDRHGCAGGLAGLVAQASAASGTGQPAA